MLRKEEAVKISSGHGDYAPDEMTRIYEDICQMARSLSIPTPLLDSYRPAFEAMNARPQNLSQPA